MTEAEGFRESLHPTLIVNCVANAFLSFTAIVLNVITIQALRKTPSLSRTLKTLLLNLSISDLGVGLLVQPLYVASLVMENEQNTNNIAFYVVRKAHIIQRQLFKVVTWYIRDQLIPIFLPLFIPWAPFSPKVWSLSPDKRIDPIHVFTQNFNSGNFVYLQI